jgi:hypothetical protein
VDGQAADIDPRVVEPVEQGAQRPEAAVAGHLQGGEPPSSRDAAPSASAADSRSPEPDELQLVPAGDAALELLRVASATILPWSRTAIRSAR